MLPELTSLLSISTLKDKKGIRSHFTVPVLYVIEDRAKDYAIPTKPSMQLNFIDPILDTLYMVNFRGRNNFSDAYEITFDAVCKEVTLPPDIRPLAYGTYQATIIQHGEKKNIPVITDEDYYAIRYECTSLEKKEFFQKKGIEDLFVVVGRFNPSRKRLVNPRFGKVIKGQVQDFRVVSKSSP